MARAKMVGGPCHIYDAARGAAKPTPAPSLDLENAPDTLTVGSVTWNLIASGDYGAAVERNFAETKNDVRPLNETYKVKKFRAEESITYTTTLIDLLPETLQDLFDNQTVTETAAVAGVAGYRELDFERGFAVVERSILIVGAAPYEDPGMVSGNNAIMVFWHPAVDIEGPGSFNSELANPSMPSMMIDVIKHETLGVGGLVANFDDPL